MIRSRFSSGDDDRARQPHRITAADAAEERVAHPPHHALGHAGGPTRVEHVQVVVAPIGHRRAIRRRLRRASTRSRPDRARRCRRPRRARRRSADDHGVAQRRHRRRHLGHPGEELLVADQRDETRVHQQVPQLLGDVAVVDVHRHRPDLEARQQRLEVLGAVRQVAADEVARTDTDTTSGGSPAGSPDPRAGRRSVAGRRTRRPRDRPPGRTRLPTGRRGCRSVGPP